MILAFITPPLFNGGEGICLPTLLLWKNAVANNHLGKFYQVSLLLAHTENTQMMGPIKI